MYFCLPIRSIRSQTFFTGLARRGGHACLCHSLSYHHKKYEHISRTMPIKLIIKQEHFKIKNNVLLSLIYSIVTFPLLWLCFCGRSHCPHASHALIHSQTDNRSDQSLQMADAFWHSTINDYECVSAKMCLCGLLIS